MRDIKYCSSCGNKLNSDSMFCDKCGQKVTKETSEIIKCPFCQSSLQKNVIKCPNCGEWINKSQKPINKKANNIFIKINKLLSNKKLFYIPNIVFIYALINTIFYQIINIINHEYFVYDTIEAQDASILSGFWIRDSYIYHLSNEMDSFTHFIHQIGIILYGDFNVLMNTYSLSGGITDSIDILWFILFLISLIVSIHVINKKKLNSYFYLILTVIAFILMLFCSRFILFHFLEILLIIILLMIFTITLKKISKHFQKYEEYK